MIFKVGLSGASGHMGLEIADMLAAGYRKGDRLLELADVVVGQSSLSEIEGVSTRRIDEPPREPVHVWIDFSRPEATMTLLEKISCPMVIGTTGFSAEQLQRLRSASETRAILLAPNMSPGMALLRTMIAALPDQLSEHFQVVLSEDHHKQKVDSPSGTAKQLKALLAERGLDIDTVQVTRAGKIIGNHTIRLISDEEELEFTHRAYDRRVFARGALEAAAFLATQKPGWYSMENVYGGNQ